jgi:LPS export ABC transporter protein LptC
MTLSTRELAVALVLIVLGGLAWWYQGRDDMEPRAVKPRDGVPDYTVEHASAVVMSEQGEPLRILDTPELRAYPDSGGTELDLPVLTVLDPEAPDGSRWIIRSESAWIAPSEDEVLLEGRVYARRDSAEEKPIRIYTSALLLLNDADYAETDRFVELTQGEDWVTAINGMRFWFRDPMRSRLYGRVRQRMMFASADDDNDEATRGKK